MAACSSKQSKKSFFLSFHELPEAVTHQITLTLPCTGVLPSGSSHAILCTADYTLYHYLLLHFRGGVDGNNDYYACMNNIFLVSYENSVAGPPKANEQKINGVSSG